MASSTSAPAPPPLTDTLARRALEREVADKHRELADEMQRIVEATFELVEQTGTVDPSMRQILAQTGLSTQAFYRHFRSKDELMLALLDEGRRRLVRSLEHRMARVSGAEAKVQAWIEGVLAQASDPRAAARTRPFVTGEARVAEMFPDEHRASVDLLLGVLTGPIGQLTGTSDDTRIGRDARAVYRLTFATLHDHLVAGEKPSKATVDHVVAFTRRGLGGHR